MLQHFANAYNANIANEAAAKSRRFTPTGTYVATVKKVEAGLMRDGETYKLNLELDLHDDNGVRAGKAWIDITPTELRRRNGDLMPETQFFYDLMRISGAADTDGFIHERLLELVFSLYGVEIFLARNENLPEQFQDPDSQPQWWRKVYINHGEDEKRDVCFAAGLKSRLEVKRVGEFRG